MHTLIVLHLWAAVTVVALFQAVIEQAQVLFHLLGLVHRVRVQDLWDQAQRAVKRLRVTCIPQEGCTSCLSVRRHHGTVPTSGRQILVTGPKEGAMCHEHDIQRSLRHPPHALTAGTPGRTFTAWAVTQEKPSTG